MARSSLPRTPPGSAAPTHWVLICSGFFLAAYSLIFHWLASGNTPNIGTDYRYFYPRFVEATDYILKNWDIHYFSRFCGGIPAYGNPQSMQFSLPQLLFLFLHPPAAVLSSVILYTVIGYWGTYRFLNRILRVDPRAAICGAMIFTCNGFFFSNMLLGFLTSLSFQLIPWVLYFLYRAQEFPRWHLQSLARLAAATLIASSFVYAGGYFVVWALLITVLLGALCFRRLDWLNLTAMGMASLLVIASKMTAILHFYPLIVHHYSISKTNGFFAALAAGISHLLAPPSLRFAGSLSVEFGWWELTASVSPVLLLPWFLKRSRKAGLFGGGHKLWLFAAIALILLLTAGAFGPLVRLNKSLPLLSSLWVLPRYAAILIFPLVCLFASALDRVDFAAYGGKTSGPGKREESEKQRTSREVPALAPWLVPSALGVLVLVVFSLYYYPAVFNWDTGRSGIRYNPGHLNTISYPLKKISRLSARQDEQLLNGAVPLRCYEPSLGYGLKGARVRARVGATQAVNDGRFNMTNPACLSYGAANGCEPWSLVPAEQSEHVARFIDNRNPGWKVSSVQVSSNWVSFLVVLGLVLLIGVALWTSRRQDISEASE